MYVGFQMVEGFHSPNLWLWRNLKLKTTPALEFLYQEKHTEVHLFLLNAPANNPLQILIVQHDYYHSCHL